MRMPQTIFYFWRNLFHKKAVDQELDAKVQACCDLLTDEKIKSGVAPDEARRLARIELGGPEQVKQLWPHGRALGHRIWFDSFDSEKRWLNIVGVVKDVREAGPSIAASGTAYVYYTQHPKQLMETNLLLRTSGDPSRLPTAVRKQIHAVSKDVPVNFQKMDSIVAAATAHQRFQVEMLGLFAWLALVLAGVGIFGVLSYLVDQSRSEIGIRMALGADPWTIIGGVLRQGFLPAVFGAVIGLVGAYGIARILSSMLYKVGPADPITYGIATLCLFMVVLLASWLPAYRAASTAPMIALRGK